MGALHQQLEAALVQYVRSGGTIPPVQLPFLPAGGPVDPVGATVYQAFLCSHPSSELRWALARLLLDLHPQWWWLGHDTMPPEHRDAVLQSVLRAHAEVTRRYAHWSTGHHALFDHCRDILYHAAASR